jgi:4,5-dihydroxyphthalate decarboxylase
MTATARELDVALAHRETADLVRRVAIEGLHLNLVADGDIPSNQIYTLLSGKHGWDVGEMALSTYLMSYDLGSDDVALPIFPSRMVPHAGVWVHERAAIATPADLVGKRVGCNSFGTNYSVWFRGVLAHQYDVPIQRITWVQSVEEHRADFRRPGRFPIEIVAGGLRSEALLFAGEIDAASMASASQPPRSDRVHALFADPYEELRSYALQFGVAPINTVLMIRRAVVERDPDLPRRLLNGFTAARAEHQHAEGRGELPIYRRLEQETGRVFTGFGFQNNLAAIREMVAYCYEQGIIRSLSDPEDLFLLSDS